MSRIDIPHGADILTRRAFEQVQKSLDALERIDPGRFATKSDLESVFNRIDSAITAINRVHTGLSADVDDFLDTRVWKDSVDRLANQAIVTATPTLVLFDTRTIDKFKLADVGATFDKIFLKRVGVWMVGGWVTWEANATGKRGVEILDSAGKTLIGDLRSAPVAGGAGTINTEHPAGAAIIQRLVDTEYIQMNVYQNSGGNLNVTANMWAVYLGM